MEEVGEAIASLRAPATYSRGWQAVLAKLDKSSSLDHP